jgi:hypothetical protein
MDLFDLMIDSDHAGRLLHRRLGITGMYAIEALEPSR